MHTEIKDIMDYIYSLEHRGIKPGLDRIEILCALMGNPQKRFKSVVIGGTNGKGSTLSFLASILKNAGYKTGAYFSPHLERFNERISIGEEQIKDSDLEKLALSLRKRVETYNLDQRDNEPLEPSFFEFTTAMALEYFAKESVDIALLEIGLGGRFDAVNIVDPILSVITNVSIDHTEFLGNTLEEIAREKAGIIKRGVPVLIGEEKSHIRGLLIKEAEQKKAPAFLLGRDFCVEKTQEGVFNFRHGNQRIDNLSIALCGDHQIKNAALAVFGAIRLADDNKLSINERNVRKGVLEGKISGRIEHLTTKMPFEIIADVAHNEAGAGVLCDYLKSRFIAKQLVILFAVMKDKNYTAMFDLLSKTSDKIILTRADNPRSWDRAALAQMKERNPGKIEIVWELKEALRHCFNNLGKDTTLCITGSHYTVGQAKAIIREDYS